ncbi:uncharacterized protein V6R79_024980 [Siganus canaliculatus]
MEGIKMETQNEQNVDHDFAAGLSDETRKHLKISEGPSSSCKRLRLRPRTKLQSTKSFPPYSQCIGGLGEDGEEGYDDLTKDDRRKLAPVAESTEDSKVQPRCAKDEVKSKWRMRRRERLGGSYEIPDRWGNTKWSGKRRVEETGREMERDDEKSEEGTSSEWKYCRGRMSSLETEQKEEGEEKVLASFMAVKKEKTEIGETPHHEEAEEAEEVPGVMEGHTGHEWTSPHPILSKLLQSSSSSCSSINLSSAESDDVFSEGEDATSKRRTFRKCRSWKTYLTMMHWSRRRQSSWVQLAGHQGNFQLSDGGEVLKLYNEAEAKCLDFLMRDPLRPFVPQYHGLITRGEDSYIRLEDLLRGLRKPVIMDCKMGVRTYQEEELIKSRNKAPLRSDMYQKMVKIDPSALSAEEHSQKAVTKWRYLQWRDTTSSTSSLGFRIEGIMAEDGSIQRDFRNTLTLTQVTEALLDFTKSQLDILKAYHSRLLALNDALQNSLFFRTHELIGSSLLFVHDHYTKANVWMIDFGKTTPVPDTSELLHNVPWAEGTREDGYLIGLTSLITSLSQAISIASWQPQDDSEGERSIT